MLHDERLASSRKSQGKNKVSKRKILSPQEGFRLCDNFGQKLPRFNIKGNEGVNTIAGGLFSIALYMVVLMYTTIKFSHLLTKHNPNISTYLKQDEMSETELYLNDYNFRFAFSIENFLGEKKQKNDSRYVKYIVRKYGKR